PAARDYTAMAFDAARREIVLFGGYTNGPLMNDTWTYDGVDWHQENPAHPPAARMLHSMSYDPVRQRVLMVGGTTPPAPPEPDERWEWNGRVWLQVAPPTHTNIAMAAMAFDPVRQQMLRFGGSIDVTPISETRAWDGTQWLLLTTGGPAPRLMVSMA